jgi:translation initiation factor IF-2
MTNRELLDKIRDLDIDVNSHMSSLDEDVVAKVKSALFGELKDDQLEEKRVKPTVIRRRKVVAPPAPEPPAAEAAAEVPATPSAPEPSAPAQTVEAPLEKGPVVKKRKPAPSAKVIARPAPQTPDLPPPVEAEAADRPSEPEDAPPPDEASEASPAAEVGPAPVESAEPEETVESEDRAGEAAAAAGPADTVEPKPKAKAKAKKAKKEAAAKIIKLPSKSDRLAAAAARPGPAAVPPRPFAPGPEADDTSVSAKDKKKGWRKKGADGDEPRFFKKKGGFRKREIVEGAALYSGKMRGRKGRKGSRAKMTAGGQKTQITTAKAIKRRVKVDETIVLSELAKRMGIKANEMIVKLMGMGVMATVNQTIDYETAVLVAGEFDYEVEKAAFEEEVILKKTDPEDPDQLIPRPPVVTIMGHVDHGKTSLLDVIRKTRVTEGEAGGITQHIGAYHVETEKGVVAFLDTPGHEAFSAMRSRGAKVTDIVILVVAADDGVMPQTVEAINHAKASGVPIIVAVNKMDKPDADPDRVQRELSEHGLVPEAWGGDAIFVMVSAKQNTGIDELLEMILLQAEVLELKANPNKLASGHVVEAKLDSGRGPVATVLVQEGTLRAGDSVVCGMHYGKIRVLQDDLGRTVESAGPSMPVEIVGLSGVPMAGDELVALADEKDARQVSQHRMQKQRSKELAKTNRLSLEGLFEQMQKGELKDLNLIIKADVDGSIEALRDSLTKLSNDEVSINVVHAATGTITESDISLAAVSNAIIIGFNVRPNAKVQELAAEEHVDMRFHNVIYNVIKEVKDAIVGMMESVFEERVLGRAEVRQTFHVPKVGVIAGCHVTDGKIQRGQLMRLVRDGVVTYEGKNSSLRRFKDDVKEVQAGYECGIGIEKFNDIKVGDVIESYYMEEIRPEVE